MQVQCVHLGLTDYSQVLLVQRRWHQWCVAQQANVLLLTQHFPVITLGYRKPHEQIKLSVGQLRKKGLRVVCVDRGGGATYHAPGQLVAYPLFSSLLRRHGVRRFVSRLEEVMRLVCLRYGVEARRCDGYPGMWVGRKKIGAVGIAVRRRVSLHGFALNVDLDLQPFADILPCGIADLQVTSLKQERGSSIDFASVEQAVIESMAAAFDVQMEVIADVRCPE